MKKKTGCLIVLTIVAAFLIGGLTVTGLIFTLLTGQATVKPPDNLSPAAAKFQSDPFYRNAGGWDYSRLGLIKPYELFSCNTRLEDSALMDISKGNSLVRRQICNVKRFNVFKHYFIAYIEAGIGRTGLAEQGEFTDNRLCYLILDLNKKGYPDFDISRDYAYGRINYDGEKIKRNTNHPYTIVTSYGKNKSIQKFTGKKAFLDQARYLGFSVKYIINNYNKIEIRMPHEFEGDVFFSEDELKAGLKARDIPEDIKLFEPKYFYQKFLDEGQCPWFPQADGK